MELGAAGQSNRSIAANLTDWLSKVGAVAAALTAIAYLAGWLTLRSYYSALGAAWYVSNISPTKVMQEGAGTLTVLAAAIYLGLQFLMSGRSAIGVDRFAKWCAIAALVLSIGGAIGHGFAAIGSQGQYVATILAGGTLLVSVGVTIALLLWQMRSPSFTWTRHHLGLVYWVYWMAFSALPFYVGQVKAEADSDLKSSRLATVTRSGSTGPQWRLVDVSGDTALLAKLAPKASDIGFQLVKIDQTLEIRHQ